MKEQNELRFQFVRTNHAARVIQRKFYPIVIEKRRKRIDRTIRKYQKYVVLNAHLTLEVISV